MTHTIDAPETLSLTPLEPPGRLLVGPRPSSPDPRVLAAMSRPVVGHLDPYFVSLMDETMNGLRAGFRRANNNTPPVVGSGSAGLETIMMNLLEPGDRAVVATVGYFGN